MIRRDEKNRFRAIPLGERFWPCVSKSDGCWEWTGRKDDCGYGTIAIDRKHRGAHRVMWELINGAIPDGRWVLHRCDNPSCVNPEHLFLGTNLDNQRDAASKGRSGPQIHPEKYRGERNPSAQLTIENVRAIRERLKRGQPHVGIAREYGVKPATITAVALRRTWAWLS